MEGIQRAKGWSWSNKASLLGENADGCLHINTDTSRMKGKYAFPSVSRILYGLDRREGALCIEEAKLQYLKKHTSLFCTVLRLIKIWLSEGLKN